MRKPASGQQLAIDILARSICSVQVGCAIADRHGIFAWGWNSAGSTGLGIHAECHAILRSNRNRLAGATLYVASRRKKNNKIVTSKPCSFCADFIAHYNLNVQWRNSDGIWVKEN